MTLRFLMCSTTRTNSQRSGPSCRSFMPQSRPMTPTSGSPSSRESRNSHSSASSVPSTIWPISAWTPEFAAICGITKEELTTTLKQDIEQLAATNGLTFERMEQELTENYDGYHFSRNCPDIFNPFSLMRCFAAGYISSYWFATGTPTYLIHQMQRFNTDVMNLDEVFAFRPHSTVLRKE